MSRVHEASCLPLQVGKELEEGYWSPGNGTAYLELVQSLTGEPGPSCPTACTLQLQLLLARMSCQKGSASSPVVQLQPQGSGSPGRTCQPGD